MITQKDEKYIEFLKTRISSNVKPEVAELMIKYALPPEEHARVGKDVEEYCFAGKSPVENPKAYLVIGQTGGGKSTLTSLILRNDPNTVVIDSDAFKAFNPQKDEITRLYPTLYGFLTGLDAYLHRDEVYSKALKEGYNILIEVAPSTKELLFNIDFEELREHGYVAVANILAACLENSLLSIHERYEGQLEAKMNSPKLTDLKRAIDSYNAVTLIIDELVKIEDVQANIFQRSPYSKTEQNTQFIQPPSFVTDDKEFLLQAYTEACDSDREDMVKYVDERIKSINEQMQRRNAPSDQRAQFAQIVELILNNLKEKKN